MIKSTVVIIAIGVAALGTFGVVLSDSERGHSYREHDHEGGHEESDWQGGWIRSREDVPPVTNETYRSECGGCHFAYQPGLLSADAWNAILDSLEAHYGDDASLDEGTATEVRSYLNEQAAERSGRSRSEAFGRGGPAGNGLPRITETRYFRREHYEIPGRLVQGNASVGSFANCQACHRGAESGVYNEHQVKIPGFGRWDD